MLEGGILSGSCSHSSCSSREAVKRSKNYLEEDNLILIKMAGVRGDRDFGSMRVEAYGPGFKFQLYHLLIMLL